MINALAHPLQTFHRPRIQMGMGGSVLDDLSDFVNNGVDGLGAAIGETIGVIVQIVDNVVKLVIQTIEATLGMIPWSDVMFTLGDIGREVGNVLVLMNPARLIYNNLTESELTKHSFEQLDKFTGGILTSAVNVSDVVARGMRGDPISSKELLQDALFILKVAIVILSGGSALVIGAMIGNMVANEVCPHQPEGQQAACRVAVTIIGAATTGYVGALEDVGEELAEDEARKTFADYVLDGTIKAATNIITTAASKDAIKACQIAKWAGEKECAILGQVSKDYVNAVAADIQDGGDGDIDWPTFLGVETGKVGTALLLAEAFPKGSPERIAIERQILSPINPITKTPVIIPKTPNTPNVVNKIETDPNKLLLLAAGALALLLAGAS